MSYFMTLLCCFRVFWMLESSINCIEESDFKAVMIFHIVIYLYIRLKQIKEIEKYLEWRLGSVVWM